MAAVAVNVESLSPNFPTVTNASLVIRGHINVMFLDLSFLKMGTPTLENI